MCQPRSGAGYGTDIIHGMTERHTAFSSLLFFVFHLLVCAADMLGAAVYDAPFSWPATLNILHIFRFKGGSAVRSKPS
jgi:hypothetical protein